MGINISQPIGIVKEFMDSCMFETTEPIGILGYQSSCFTWGLVVSIIFIILVITGWEGI